MVKVTRWRPDTCGCIIDYSWDADDAARGREIVVTWHATQKTCPDHDGLTGPEHYAVVHAENRAKNLAVGILYERLPELSALPGQGDVAGAIYALVEVLVGGEALANFSSSRERARAVGAFMRRFPGLRREILAWRWEPQPGTRVRRLVISLDGPLGAAAPTRAELQAVLDAIPEIPAGTAVVG